MFTRDYSWIDDYIQGADARGRSLVDLRIELRRFKPPKGKPK